MHQYCGHIINAALASQLLKNGETFLFVHGNVVTLVTQLWLTRGHSTNPKYRYVPDGRIWAGSGSTIKPVRGPHVFHTMKIGISEDKCGNSKKGQNVTNCPPNGWRALFCKNTNLNSCTAQLGANPLEQGVALIKIGFWGGHIVQGFCAGTNLKIFVCIQNAFFLHLAKFCILNFWNACFCSLISFWDVRDFRPDFGVVSNLKIFVCIKDAFSLHFANFVLLASGMPLFVVQ